MVREFQRVISTEARAQMLERYGRLPDAVAACVGGGSNAMGMFADFIDDRAVRLYGFEAGGRRRRDRTPRGDDHRRHRSASCTACAPTCCRTRTARPSESHSISAGLDYPGVGPEHAWLAATGRATYEPVTDAEAMEAFRLLTRTEGIMPAIESAHALAGALRLGRRLAEERARRCGR